MDVSDQRIQDIEARTYHIDGRVTAIESQLATTVQTLGRIEQRQIEHAEGNRPNVAVWVGMAISGVFGVIGMVVTLGSWVDLQLEPLRDSLIKNDEFHTVIENFRHQQHYEVGVLHSEKEKNAEDLKETKSRLLRLEERIAKVEAEEAANKVARQAMGDYIRQIDELGSRKWITGQDAKASRVEPVR